MAVIYKWRVHKSAQRYMLRYLFYLLLQTLLTNENTWRPNRRLICSKANRRDKFGRTVHTVTVWCFVLREPKCRYWHSTAFSLLRILMFMYSYCYICSVPDILFHCVVLCIVCAQMFTVLLPPGVNPVPVNKYIVSSKAWITWAAAHATRQRVH